MAEKEKEDDPLGESDDEVTESQTKFNETELELIKDTMKEAALNVNIHEVLRKMWIEK